MCIIRFSLKSIRKIYLLLKKLTNTDCCQWISSFKMELIVSFEIQRDSKMESLLKTVH